MINYRPIVTTQKPLKYIIIKTATHAYKYIKNLLIYAFKIIYINIKILFLV